MRIPIISLVVITLALCQSSSAIDRKRQLVNRPSEQTMISRLRRTAFLPTYIKYFKEPGAPVKGGSSLRSPSDLSREVRKGEYVCGDRICQLKPGEVPPGCNGICQYPI